MIDKININGKPTLVGIREQVRINGKYYFLDEDGIPITEDPIVNDIINDTVNKGDDYELIADGYSNGLMDVYNIALDLEDYLNTATRINRNKIKSYVNEILDITTNLV